MDTLAKLNAERDRLSAFYEAMASVGFGVPGYEEHWIMAVRDEMDRAKLEEKRERHSKVIHAFNTIILFYNRRLNEIEQEIRDLSF